MSYLSYTHRRCSPPSSTLYIPPITDFIALSLLYLSFNHDHPLYSTCLRLISTLRRSRRSRTRRDVIALIATFTRPSRHSHDFTTFVNLTSSKEFYSLLCCLHIVSLSLTHLDPLDFLATIAPFPRRSRRSHDSLDFPATFDLDVSSRSRRSKKAESRESLTTPSHQSYCCCYWDFLHISLRCLLVCPRP